MTTKNVKVMRFKFIQTVACYCINAATLKGLPDKVIEPLTFFNCEHSSHLLEGGGGRETPVWCSDCVDPFPQQTDY